MGVGNPDESSGDGPAILLACFVLVPLLLAGGCKAADHYWPGWGRGAPSTHDAKSVAPCSDH
jgi:hypothetical protein